MFRGSLNTLRERFPFLFQDLPSVTRDLWNSRSYLVPTYMAHFGDALSNEYREAISFRLVHDSTFYNGGSLPVQRNAEGSRREPPSA